MGASAGPNKVIGFFSQAWVAPLVISIVAFTALASTLSLWFTGVDIFPLILSARVDASNTLLYMFRTEFLSAYHGLDIAGSVGYRPMGMLSFALDYAIWGLNPAGYHLSNLLLHTLNSILVFFFVRQLGFANSSLVGFLAALLFANHPISLATVPSIPARFDILLCTFTLLSLIFFLKHLHSGRLGPLVLALLFGGCAFLSKASGIVLWPALTLTALVEVRVKGRSARQVFPALLGVSVIFLALLVVRSWVIDGLGGYPLRGSEYGMDLIFIAKRLGELLSYPLPLPVPAADRILGKILLVLFYVGGLALLGGGIATCVMGRDMFRSARIGEELRREALNCFLLAAYATGFFALYVGIFLSMHIFKVYYLYVVAGFWCPILAALLSTALANLRNTLRQPRSSLLPTFGSGVVVIAGLLVLVSTVLGGPILRGVEEWPVAGEMARDYLQAVDQAAQSLPDGATLFLINLPHRILCSNRPCFGNPHVFEDYSVDAWFKLTRPEKRIQFITVSAVLLYPSEREMRSTISHSPGSFLIAIQNSAGRIEAPWHTKANDFFLIKIEPSRSPKRVEISWRAGSMNEGRYFLFDFFGSPRLFPLAAPGLSEPSTPSLSVTRKKS